MWEAKYKRKARGTVAVMASAEYSKLTHILPELHGLMLQKARVVKLQLHNNRLTGVDYYCIDLGLGVG